QQQIAELEKADLPQNLTALLAPVKAAVVKYSDAFEKASTNLLLGDELYYKAITPLTVSAVEKLEAVQESIGQAFQHTTASTEGIISSTVIMQETVAGAATALGLLIAFLIARRIIGPLSGLTSGMK